MIHVCINETIKYEDAVPDSGPHRPQWPTYGEYSYIPAQRWVHSLEHGLLLFRKNLINFKFNLIKSK